MVKTKVVDNAIEVKVPRSDLLLFGLSALLGVALGVFAGWQIAAAALVLSVAGAAIVVAVQRWGDSGPPRSGAAWDV